MNFTHLVFDEKYLTAIGWTLAQSIWQIALVSGLLWVVLRVMARASSRHRYAAGLSALVLMLLLSGWTFLDQLSQISSNQREQVLTSIALSEQVATVAFISAGDAEVMTQPFSLSYLVGQIEKFLPYLVNLWMLGALFYAVRLLGSFYDLHKLHRKHHESVSSVWLKKVDSLSAALGLYHKVQVLTSTLVRTPITYGYLKPVILLPASLVFSLSPAQMEAIIAHELAHIKRNDYLVNLLQSCMEVVFFFHPCFWWVNQLVNEERENATDDLALAAGVSSYDLAYGLAEVANYSGSPAPDMALAASGNNHTTLQRIKRILGHKASSPKLSPLIPLTMLLALITASALIVSAQDQNLKKEEPQLLTKISSEIIVSNIVVAPPPVSVEEDVQFDTLPAQIAPKAPSTEDMPQLNLTPPPQLDVLAPFIPDLPPAPPIAFNDFDFPQLDIHFQTDSMADLAMQLQALKGSDSPEARKKRKAIQDAMDKVGNHIQSISQEWAEKMADWEAQNGDLLKKYELDMKDWEVKMKEHQKSWEATMGPKMEEFEKKMKLWEEENQPKIKAYEEKMKRWMEENEEKFNWQEGVTPVPF